MPNASLYLDDRKTRDLKPAPPASLKVRVYVDRENIRHFKTNFSITAQELEDSYNSKNPRGENKKLKTKIEAIKVKADKIIERLGDGFTFEKFEREFYVRPADKNNVITCYNDYIDQLNANDQVGTADTYRLSLNSLLAFKGDGKPVANLTFQSITVKFLNDYERWFTKEVEGKKSKSLTSVGIYLRNLRFIFNQAIAAGDISKDNYPFGKDKYIIPTGSNTKKAIDNVSLKALYTVELETGSSMKMARDFWFFSYQCNGMNFKDIASLKYKDLKSTSFSFRRQKTKRTIKDKNVSPIMVPITDSIKQIIKEYGNDNRDPDNYVFPIFTRGMSEKEKMRVDRNFIRFVNDNMQRLAGLLSLISRWQPWPLVTRL